MTCEEVTQKLMELPVERFGELESHLSTCSACRAKAERIKETEAVHRRILEEDRDLPPVGPDGNIAEGARQTRIMGLTAFNQGLKDPPKKGGFLRPFALTLLVTALVAVIFGPRILRQKTIMDQAPTPTMGDMMAVLAGTPAAVSSPTAPARVTILPFIIQEGRKVQAPSSIPPRTSLFFALNATQNANVDLCMSWPGATQAIWSGYLGPGRVEVPPKGYVMDITGQYTFSISRTGDGLCKETEGEVKLEVLP